MSKKKELRIRALMAICDNIDFCDIANYYSECNWKWGGAIPSAAELCDQVHEFIHKLTNEKLSTISSGGITVHCYPGQLMIMFSAYKNPGEVWYGQSHDELSPLEDVTDYLEYMQERYAKKAAKKRNVT